MKFSPAHVKSFSKALDTNEKIDQSDVPFSLNPAYLIKGIVVDDTWTLQKKTNHPGDLVVAAECQAMSFNNEHLFVKRMFDSKRADNTATYGSHTSARHFHTLAVLREALEIISAGFDDDNVESTCQSLQ